MGQNDFAGAIEPDENPGPMLFDGWGFVPLADAELAKPELPLPAERAQIEPA